MIKRSRFTSLLAIVAFLYVIIVLSQLNNPMPPDGPLIVASFYGAAMLTKGSLTSTLVAVLTVPLCVTSVQAEETSVYFRVDSSTGSWWPTWPSVLRNTTSIGEGEKITIRMIDTVKVTIAVDDPKSFSATVSLSPPKQSSDGCKKIKVNLGPSCTATWETKRSGKELSFDDQDTLKIGETDAGATLIFTNPGVIGKNQQGIKGDWPNDCLFDKEPDLFQGKTVIFLQIEPDKTSQCVMSMELNSNTYLLLKNEDRPTTPITTTEPTNTTYGNTTESSGKPAPPGGGEAAGADPIIIAASCGGVLLLVLIVIGIVVTIVCVRRGRKKSQRQPKKYQKDEYKTMNSVNQSTVNKSSQVDKSKKESPDPEPVAPPPVKTRCTTDANGYELVFPVTPKKAPSPPQDVSQNPQDVMQHDPNVEAM